MAKKRKTKKRKSAAVSKVLKLMDKDFSYTRAVKSVLRSDKRLARWKLEKELEQYI